VGQPKLSGLRRRGHEKVAILYERGYRMADLGHDIKITPATVFPIGSMSKQFTAAAVLMLVQQEKVSLDDPIRKYIPEVPDFGAPIILRELLHQTSGLRDQWQLLKRRHCNPLRSSNGYVPKIPIH
jgi:CubicO group peptidase (beta-lactamase class C family)